jgi:hypothetical protein
MSGPAAALRRFGQAILKPHWALDVGQRRFLGLPQKETALSFTHFSPLAIARVTWF